ncbi:DUF6268 family outer membrane beta-barrel protein [Chitinophagaceae bacterium LWZ2-11]
MTHKLFKVNFFISAALLVCLLFTQKVNAQLGASSLRGQGIAVNMEYFPASHYIRPEDSLKTNSTTGIRRYAAGMGFILHKKVDTAAKTMRMWALSAGGSYMKFDNQKYDTAVFPSELLGANIMLQHLRSLKNRWSLLALLSVGVYTDMQAVTSKDVFVNGGVIFIKQSTPSFSYGFGAVLTNTFGTPMLLPGVLLNWQTGRKYKVEIELPQAIRVGYSFGNFTELAVALRMNGGSYDIENRPDNRRLMAYKEITAGLENKWHIGKMINLNIAGGAALARSIEYKEKSWSEMFKQMPQHKLENNWYVSAGISVNFK